MEAVQTTLDKYIRYVSNLTDETVGATYGQVIRNLEEIWLVIGWRSIEVRTFSCTEDKAEMQKWWARKDWDKWR